MSRNLYKSGWVVVKNDDAIVIDTNELADRKLKDLEAALEEEKRKAATTAPDGFSEGLNAQRIDVLPSEEGVGDLAGEGRQEMEELTSQIEEAKNELEQLRIRADQMIQEARTEIESERQTAYEQGKNQGYEEGYQIAVREGEQAKQECEDMKRRLNQEYQAKIDELEPRFIDLLSGIYEHVIGVELESNKSIITHLIGRTIRKIEGSRDFLVHVSKNEYPYVSMAKKELLEGMASSQTTIEIIEDVTLAQGQCFIETEGGIYDCGLDTQLSELGKKLKLLSLDI